MIGNTHRQGIIVAIFALGLVLFVPVTKAQDFPQNLVLPTPVLQASTTPVVDNTVNTKQKLEEYIKKLDRPTLGPLTFMRYLIHEAVSRGVSANLIVFLLLFPVIASIVAFSRHVIGLTGFSIYAPAALGVVLLSTGIVQGIVLFFIMLAVAIIGKFPISRLKMEYVPRTAMLLWFVALGMFFMLLLSTLLPVNFFLPVDMFPLLILVLLAEDFMSMQAELKWTLAMERALQIMALAAIGALIMGNQTVQEFSLSHPELVVMCVAVFNFFVGKYLGLRLTEYLRFKPIIDAEE